MGFFADRKKKKQEKARRELLLDARVGGRIAYEKGDYKTAFEKFWLAAENGDDECIFTLAQEYEKGEHVQRDLEQARELYEKCLDTGYECSARMHLFHILNNSNYVGVNRALAMEHLEKAVSIENQKHCYNYGAHYERALIYAQKGYKSQVEDDLVAAFPLSSYWLPAHPGLQRLKDDIERYHLPVNLGMLAYMTTQEDERAAELFIPMYLEYDRFNIGYMSLYERYACVYTNPYLHHLMGRRYREYVRNNRGTQSERETNTEFIVYHCLALEDNLMISDREMRERKKGFFYMVEEVRIKSDAGKKLMAVLDLPAPPKKFQ